MGKGSSGIGGNTGVVGRDENGVPIVSYARLKPSYKKEMQRLVYEDMNAKTSGWLKQNAPKYGFEYILTR